jgi:hypothetical protein
VIRSLGGVSSRTSCRQLFKELNILTLASLYTCIFEVTAKTEIYKKSVINMGTKVYNNLPKFLKEIDDYKAFKKELKLFLPLQTFYSVEEFVFS